MPQPEFSYSVDSLDVGDEVYDSDAEDPKTAIVISLPGLKADEWDVTEEETVAELNPDYPEKAEVVVVAFEEDLDDWWPDWTEHDPDELFDEMCERGHKFYAFPAPRLRETEGSALDGLEEAISDAGYPVERDVEEGVLVVDKFGEYRIHPDGTVEGEGSLAERLRTVVQGYRT